VRLWQLVVAVIMAVALLLVLRGATSGGGRPRKPVELR
jgi:hypothetical protein